VRAAGGWAASGEGLAQDGRHHLLGALDDLFKSRMVAPQIEVFLKWAGPAEAFQKVGKPLLIGEVPGE
jgi:hypothetical protein